MIKEATQILSQGKDLSPGAMRQVMEEIMSGKLGTEPIVSFLMRLSEKGETVEELTAAAEVMRGYAACVNTKHKIILDTCGTGADNSRTFNISTISAFVASGAGIPVAKHGNRSVSSCCGSADILEALGININMSNDKIGYCLDEIGIAFLFAQNLHPAMKYAMPARKQIGRRTLFNILGPLSNPAGATHQLVGVYDGGLAEIVAGVLANLGAVHALVIHGEDGLDEITTTAASLICEEYKGKIKNYKVSPEDFGIKRAKLEDLAGGACQDNARIALEVLGGKAGPQRDIVLLNAGAAIYAGDKAKSIKQGIELAAQSIDSKRALEKLEMLKQYSLTK